MARAWWARPGPRPGQTFSYQEPVRAAHRVRHDARHLSDGPPRRHRLRRDHRAVCARAANGDQLKAQRTCTGSRPLVCCSGFGCASALLVRCPSKSWLERCPRMTGTGRRGPLQRSRWGTHQRDASRGRRGSPARRQIQARFEAALRQISSPNADTQRQAAVELEALAREKQSELAPEALFEAGQQYRRAPRRSRRGSRRCYRALVHGYPQSRLLRRANQRLLQLDHALPQRGSRLVRLSSRSCAPPGKPAPSDGRGY